MSAVIVPARLLAIPVDLIDVGDNVRSRPAGISELAASIAEHGVLQPIRVRQDGARYRLVFGQRRLLAARQAGLATIPAAIDEGAADGVADAIQQLAENLQRQDLDPIEEATALNRVLAKTRLTQKELAAQLGRSAPYVSNMLRLLELVEPVRQLLAAGKLTRSHGTLLNALGRKDQAAFATDAVTHGWSTNELDRRIAIRLGSGGRTGGWGRPGQYSDRATRETEAIKRIRGRLNRLADRIERELASRPTLPMDTNRRIAAELRAVADDLPKALVA